MRIGCFFVLMCRHEMKYRVQLKYRRRPHHRKKERVEDWWWKEKRGGFKKHYCGDKLTRWDRKYGHKVRRQLERQKIKQADWDNMVIDHYRLVADWL